MILLDTSVLVGSFTGEQQSAPLLRKVIEGGERILLPALVLYEWLRGPRLTKEIELQETLFPSESAVHFGPEEAIVTARLYRQVSRARGREIDLAIAACAITRDAGLWTLNQQDFRDIPGLRLTP